APSDTDPADGLGRDWETLGFLFERRPLEAGVVGFLGPLCFRQVFPFRRRQADIDAGALAVFPVDAHTRGRVHHALESESVMPRRECFFIADPLEVGEDIERRPDLSSLTRFVV